MTDRQRMEPGPDHPITISDKPGVVTVRRGATTIAETRRALELAESGYAPVLYVPLADVDRDRLARSDHHTYCPYKGEASYYDLVTGDEEAATAAAWYYDEPYAAVDAIRDHVAFYTDRVNVTVELPDRSART